MYIYIHSHLRILLSYIRGPSGPLHAHNHHSFFSPYLQQCLHIPEKPALPSFLQFKKLHQCSSVFGILSYQNILRRITPAANSVCTSMQFIRGYIKYTTYDQHLLAHWIRIISLSVADAALCDSRFLRELLLAHPPPTYPAVRKSSLILSYVPALSDLSSMLRFPYSMHTQQPKFRQHKLLRL